MKKVYFSIIIFSVLSIVLIPFFLNFSEKKHVEEIVARVGSYEISLKSYKEQKSKIYNNTDINPIIRENLLNRLIVERLLLEEAKERGITVNAEDIQKYTNMIKSDYSDYEFEQELLNDYETKESWDKDLKKYILLRKVASNIVADQIKVSPDLAITYYNAYILPSNPKIVEIAQIFSTSKRKIEKAYKELETGKSFSDVVKKYSESPEAQNNGYIGIIDKNFPKVFNIAFKLQTDDISNILKSPYGYHIIKVLNTSPKYKKTKELAINHLMAVKGKKIYTNWLAKKLSQTKIFKNLALINSIE